MATRTRLVNLAVKNVAAVGSPANRRKWLVMKATSYKVGDMVGHMKVTAVNEDGTYDVEMEDGTTRRGMKLASPRETAEKSLNAAYMDFVSDVQKSIPDVVLDADDLKKAGKKISAERLTKLRALHKTLGEIILEGEDMMEKKVDATALSKMGNAIAAMFGRAAGADDETIAELEKAAGTKEADDVDPTDAAMAEAAAANAELRKSNKELKALLVKAEADSKAHLEARQKAEAEVATLRSEKELEEFRKEVANYADMGLDPTKDAALFKAMTDKLDPEHVARMREIFKSTSAVVKKGTTKLFKEVGATGVSGRDGAETAVEEVEQRISETMQKNEKLDRSGALNQVFQSDPALYERWRSETRVRV